MTILLHKGEHITLKISADSKYGKGTLYITNKAVAYEVEGKGIYLNFVPFDIIQRFYISGKGIGHRTKKYKMIWVEKDSEYSIEFKVKNHQDLKKILTEIKTTNEF